MNDALSTGEVSKLLGVPAHRIDYAHSTGQLAEPALRFLGKRVYGAEDVRRLARHFGVALEDATPKEDAEGAAR